MEVPPSLSQNIQRSPPFREGPGDGGEIGSPELPSSCNFPPSL